MIYVGYPCIGKTSIAGTDNFIDLESSEFNDGSGGWVKEYIKVARILSDQGSKVLLSSHKGVREELTEQGIPYVCIFPALTLKDSWFNRLAIRYKETGSEKNLRALARWHYYDNDIKDLMHETNIMVIRDSEYDLKEFIANTKIETQHECIGIDKSGPYQISGRSAKLVEDNWDWALEDSKPE